MHTKSNSAKTNGHTTTHTHNHTKDRMQPSTADGGGKWKSQQVRRKTKKRKGQVQISELFVEEKCSPAVLDFLRSAGVGRTVRT